MTTISLTGTLEVDLDRGVLYFHDDRSGITRLRICRLPTPVPNISVGLNTIDLTLRSPPGVSYHKQED